MGVNKSVDGQIYQAKIKWFLHGQECLNVLCFKAFGVADLDDDFAQVLINCLVSSLIPSLSNELTLFGVDYKNMTGSVAQEGSVAATTGADGGVDSQSLPTTNAMVVSLKSSHVGRSGRGRMFLPGIPESFSQSSEINATALQASAAFLACMFEHFRAADPPASPRFDWMVHSRKDAQFYPIITGATKKFIGTMRSRRVGG